MNQTDLIGEATDTARRRDKGLEQIIHLVQITHPLSLKKPNLSLSMRKKSQSARCAQQATTSRCHPT
jgi:hypothetical protein